jgi:uncharacterized protein
MRARVFVNLPVKDLRRSVEFFGRLGFRFDPRFTDEKATCMVIGEDACVMLLVGSFFETFTPKPIVDARRGTEALVALALGSRAEVDQVVDAALAAGARTIREADDHAFMYGRSFEDLDGHIWELFWMDPARLGDGVNVPSVDGAGAGQEMVVARIIDAPREAVYAAWTQPERLWRWFGPAGFTLPRCEVDVRVGGSYRFVMRAPDGVEHPFHGTYREIAANERLVFTAVVEGEHGGEQLTEVRFAALGRRTRVTVRQTAPRHEAFARGQEQGWSESLERLGALVARS